MSRILGLIFAFSLGVLPGVGEAAQDTYKISGIQVDITAENGQEAQKRAFFSAQKKAFNDLIQQLTRQPQLTLEVSQETLEALTQSHTVESEKRSPVRYIATLTLRFDKQKVETYLAEKEIPFNAYALKPLLILPVYKKAARILLWEEDNKWMEAWEKASQKSIRVSFDLPEGNLQDIQDLSPSEAFSQDVPEIQKLSHRYGTEGAVVTVYSEPTGEESQVSIEMWYISLTGDVFKIPLDSENKSFSSMGQAVQTLSEAIEVFIESQSKREEAQKKSLKAVVKVKNHEEWVRTRKILEQEAFIGNLKILSLSPHQIQISFDHMGEVQDLQKRLLHHNLHLNTSKRGDWIIASNTF